MKGLQKEDQRVNREEVREPGPQSDRRHNRPGVDRAVVEFGGEIVSGPAQCTGRYPTLEG
jgi:hypothetical protein